MNPSNMSSQPVTNESSRAESRRATFVQVFVGASCCVVLLIAGFWLGSTQPSRQATAPLPPMLAAAAAASDNLAVATGQVSDDAEGIFFLDFITGDLQCLVYYPRQGAFGARYFANVQPHLGGGGKNAKYLMVTGQAVTRASSGGARPGASLVYVTDVTSGLFAAYAIPWDQSLEASGREQSGPMIYVGGGPIRNYQLRDANKQAPNAIVDPNRK